MSHKAEDIPVVVDAGTAWVRSLFVSVSQYRYTGLLNIHSAGNWACSAPWRWPWPSGWRRTSGMQGDPRVWRRTVPIAGWTRGARISTALVTRAVKSSRSAFGANTAVFTVPCYADAAARLPRFRRIYFAYDPYQFYQWDRQRTLDQQQKMVEVCDAIFAVSRALVDDFRKQTSKPIFYLPNAVSKSFVDAMNGHACQQPEDLAVIPRPIVGCTGQINGSYDWEFIAAVAAAAREISFVFIGPLVPENAAGEAKIRKVLQENVNVHWLGSRPHAQLPDYLQSFDVCFNPLAVNDHNNRRSPLRLYDYLASQKPVVSTAISEAIEHGEFVEIAHDAEQAVSLFREMIGKPVNTEARKAYISQNTWSTRAQQFLSQLESL